MNFGKLCGPHRKATFPARCCRLMRHLINDGLAVTTKRALINGKNERRNRKKRNCDAAQLYDSSALIRRSRGRLPSALLVTSTVAVSAAVLPKRKGGATVVADVGKPILPAAGLSWRPAVPSSRPDP